MKYDALMDISTSVTYKNNKTSMIQTRIYQGLHEVPFVFVVVYYIQQHAFEKYDLIMKLEIANG